jgi:hypothetical protein
MKKKKRRWHCPSIKLYRQILRHNAFAAGTNKFCSSSPRLASSGRFRPLAAERLSFAEEERHGAGYCLF